MINLGLAIQITQAGMSVPTIINDGPWCKNIIDVRNLLVVLHRHGSSCSNIPMSFSYTNDGMLITLMREIKGRKCDNVCAFIFIPKDIEINCEELYEVVNTVKQDLCKSSSDSQGLKELFSREYRKKSPYVEYKKSADTGYAYRIVPNRYSLKELLGEERYQEYYTKYKCVFILENEDVDENKELGKTENSEIELVNLTDRELETYCSLIPPTEAELYHDTHLDVILRLENGEPMNSVITKLKGEKIKFICERTGFENVEFSYTFNKLGDKLDLEVLKGIEWFKRISPRNFQIIDIDTNKRIEGCSILVNDEKINNTGVLLQENQAKVVSVTITHPDYNTLKRNYNLKDRNIITITLEPKEVKYTYGIRLQGGYGEGELSFITKRKIKQESSPLAHYRLQHRILVYDKNKETKMKRKYAIRYFIIGLVLSSLVWSAILLFIPEKTKNERNKFPRHQRYENFQPIKSPSESSITAFPVEDETKEVDTKGYKVNEAESLKEKQNNSVRNKENEVQESKKHHIPTTKSSNKEKGENEDDKKDKSNKK